MKRYKKYLTREKRGKTLPVKSTKKDWRVPSAGKVMWQTIAKQITEPKKWKSIVNYYISQLVRALWLVNLAGGTLLYGPLKFKVSFVAKLFRDFVSISVLNFYSK